MTVAIQPHSLSCVLQCSFSEALVKLRSALQREELEVICELPFQYAFQKSMGVTCRRYTVVIVWNQFDAWRAVLTEKDAGLLTPFNIAVIEEGKSTVIAVSNWTRRRQACATVGVTLMLHAAEARIRRVFAMCEYDERAAAAES